MNRRILFNTANQSMLANKPVRTVRRSDKNITVLNIRNIYRFILNKHIIIMQFKNILINIRRPQNPNTLAYDIPGFIRQTSSNHSQIRKLLLLPGLRETVHAQTRRGLAPAGKHVLQKILFRQPQRLRLPLLNTDNPVKTRKKPSDQPLLLQRRRNNHTRIFQRCFRNRRNLYPLYQRSKLSTI